MSNIQGLDRAITLYNSLKEFLSRKDVVKILVEQFTSLEVSGVSPTLCLYMLIYELVDNEARADGNYTDDEAMILEKITGVHRNIEEQKNRSFLSFSASKQVPVAVILTCYADHKLHKKMKKLTVVDDICELVDCVAMATAAADGFPVMTEFIKRLELTKSTRAFIENYKQKRDVPINWEKIIDLNFYRR